MVTICVLWEHGWFNNIDTEAFIFTQLQYAYLFERLVLITNNKPFGTTPIETFPTADEALATMIGERVFMTPPGRRPASVPMQDFTHPTDAVYIFGNSQDDLLRYVNPSDYLVHIKTPGEPDMFAMSVVGQILYDRMIKSEHR
jgi:hypothetical protein